MQIKCACTRNYICWGGAAAGRERLIYCDSREVGVSNDPVRVRVFGEGVAFSTEWSDFKNFNEYSLITIIFVYIHVKGIVTWLRSGGEVPVRCATCACRRHCSETVSG